jgi:nucleoside-diphosphate-sugar epimerase
MKLFVTGGTGVIGRPAVAALRDSGHEVRAVARRAEAAERLRSVGAEPVEVDLFDGVAVRAAVGDSDGVLHLATNVPLLRKAVRTSGWATHNRLRTVATRHLADAARAGGAALFVKESITFVYADAGDRWIDESAPLADPLDDLQATKDGEDIASELVPDGVRVVVLRFGLFYGGVGNRATDDALRLAKLGGSTIAGKPGSYMSSIHVDDAAAAVAASVDAPSGVYNACDDEPLTRREHLDALSAGLRLRRLHTTPGAMLRATAGAPAKALLSSQRCSNRKLRDATGWNPRYGSARDGWHAEGERLRSEVRSDV